MEWLMLDQRSKRVSEMACVTILRHGEGGGMCKNFEARMNSCVGEVVK